MIQGDDVGETQRVTTQYAQGRNDKAPFLGLCVIKMAEAMGFELMDLLQSTVFKTVALNHSATPPYLLRPP